MLTSCHFCHLVFGVGGLDREGRGQSHGANDSIPVHEERHHRVADRDSGNGGHTQIREELEQSLDISCPPKMRLISIPDDTLK